MNNFSELERRDFRARLDHFLHPARHIEDYSQLKGRQKSIIELRDACETPGAHPFIWGPRGIGKTSLGHTYCLSSDHEVTLVSAVACSKSTKFRELIDDIIADANEKKSSLFQNAQIKASLSGYGFTISTDISGIKSDQTELTVNQAASMLDRVFGKKQFPYETPVIIIDEFDRLEDSSTFQAIGDTVKQLSTRGAQVKFCFCGVTDDLAELISAHESVERYIYGVELTPLSHDSIWAMIQDIENEFQISFDRGQTIRIGQIAAGYPHFVHLILQNVLLEFYDRESSDSDVDVDIFRGALNRSANQAAPRLRTAYEAAIRKGTDKYIEVLFAVANSPHLNRQFKAICNDYEKIMSSRTNKMRYDTDKNNGQDFRNALNSLSDRGFLRKGKTGWYQFHDPMLRSYVRLVAETEGIELSDDNFPT